MLTDTTVRHFSDNLNIGKKIIRYCNFTGVANFDMRFDIRDQSIKVLECNPRFWESLDASMLTGVNFPYLGIILSQKDKIEYINYKEINYIVPKAFIFKLLRLRSEDINGHNTYFLRHIINDPMYYFYFVPFALVRSIKDFFKKHIKS